MTTDIDTSKPHSARFWNYWLGGKDYYAADARIAERIAREWPGLVDVARTSRHFLARAVRYAAAEAGMRQFLDIGAGLPTVDNTHEIAQRVAPESRIVYVDNDPLVLVHSQALLTSAPQGRTEFLDADVRNPERLLELAGLVLNLSRPVAVVMAGVLGHVGDYDEARSTVRRLFDGLPSGSCLILRDCTSTSEQIVAAAGAYNGSGAAPYHVRSVGEIVGFFDGLHLVKPGVVRVTEWRPEVDMLLPCDPVDAFGGVAHKP